jgi:hypothetical protein
VPSPQRGRAGGIFVSSAFHARHTTLGENRIVSGRLRLLHHTALPRGSRSGSSAIGRSDDLRQLRAEQLVDDLEVIRAGAAARSADRSRCGRSLSSARPFLTGIRDHRPGTRSKRAFVGARPRHVPRCVPEHANNATTLSPSAMRSSMPRSRILVSTPCKAALVGDGPSDHGFAMFVAGHAQALKPCRPASAQNASDADLVVHRRLASLVHARR